MNLGIGTRRKRRRRRLVVGLVDVTRGKEKERKGGKRMKKEEVKGERVEEETMEKVWGEMWDAGG